MGDHVLLVDSFDRRDLSQVARSVRAFGELRRRLNKQYALGRAVTEDLFLALYKAVPQVVGPDDVDGDAVIVRALVIEALTMPAIEALRRSTIGDRVQAALVVVELEAFICWLLEQYANEKAASHHVDVCRAALATATDVAVEGDDIVDQVMGSHESAQVVDRAVAQAMESRRLQGEAEKLLTAAEEQLAAMLEEAAPGMRASVTMAVSPVNDDLRRMAEAGLAWGVEPGAVARMRVKDRLALHKKLRSRSLQEIVDLFGSMHNLATSTVPRSAPGVDEFVGLGMGNDFDALAGSELVNLGDPTLTADLLLRLGEGEAVVNEREGVSAGRGGIVLLIDGSMSMLGTRERYAKALLLQLWHTARDEGRSLHVVHFGGRNQIRHYAFTKPSDFTFERLLECVDLAFLSGTDFESPMRKAIEILAEEFRATGKVRSDVVFVSDGESNVSAGFMAGYLEYMGQVQATTWAVLVSEHPVIPGGPLYHMSGGKVSHVTDLVSGRDVAELLGGAA